MNRLGRGFWMVLIFCVIGALVAFWIYKMTRDTPPSATQTAPTTQRIRAAIIDFRKIAPADRAISDLKNARADVVMVWGISRRDFNKLTADLGMIHHDYDQGNFGVISRWRLYRPTRLGNGLTVDQSINGRVFKIQCGASQTIENAMGISAADGDLAPGFDPVVRIKTGLNMGVSQGWTVHNKGDFPSQQGGWMEIGWK